MTNELVPWQPSKFEGADLLPVALGGPRDLTGRENVEASDIVIPTLCVLNGMSDEVTKQTIPGAVPGMFCHRGAQEAFKGPVRVLVIQHNKSRALFPKADNPDFNGLKTCISRDFVSGSEYGDCSSCPHKEWGANNRAPLCSESHNFVVLTSFGPAVIRFSRTSFGAAKNFVTTWMSGGKALWSHPAIITTSSESKTLPNGKQATYYTLAIRWAQREDVPPAVVQAAREFYEQVSTAHEQGRLQTDQRDE